MKLDLNIITSDSKRSDDLKKMRADFRRRIEEISDPEDKEISKAMDVLVTALKVVPDADQLVEKTGYPRAFIDGIVTRMQEAKLWSNDLVDDREWWGEDGEIKGVMVFMQGHVALGLLKREETPTSIRYIEVSSGDVVGEYPDSEIVH